MSDEQYAYIPQELAERINVTLHPCPVCYSPMILKENRITIYIGCSKCNIEAPFSCDCRNEDYEFFGMATKWNQMARSSVAAKLETENARLQAELAAVKAERNLQLLIIRTNNERAEDDANQITRLTAELDAARELIARNERTAVYNYESINVLHARNAALRAELEAARKWAAAWKRSAKANHSAVLAYRTLTDE